MVLKVISALSRTDKGNCIFSNPKAEIYTSRSCLSIAVLTPLIHQDVWPVINVVTDILLLMQMDSVQCPKLSRKHIHLWVLEVSMSIIYVYGGHLITCIIKLWSDVATVGRWGGGWPIAEEDIKEIFFYVNWVKKIILQNCICTFDFLHKRTRFNNHDQALNC